MNNTTIVLKPIDVQKYELFLEYYDLFTLLLDKHVFEQKGAGITINFDAKGNIGSITRNDVLYLSNVPFDNNNPKQV